MTTTFQITCDERGSRGSYYLSEFDGDKFVQSWGPYETYPESLDAKAYLEEQAKRNPLLWPNPRKS